MKKKAIAGLALSALLVWLSVRGIEFRGVIDGFRTIRCGYVLPAVAVMFLMQTPEIHPLGAHPETHREGRSALPLLRHQRRVSGHHRHPGAPGRAGPALSHREKEPHPHEFGARHDLRGKGARRPRHSHRRGGRPFFHTAATVACPFQRPVPVCDARPFRGDDPDDRPARGVAPRPGPPHWKASGTLCRGRKPADRPFHRRIPDHGRSGASALRSPSCRSSSGSSTSWQSISSFWPSASTFRSRQPSF